jgi:hypothetical protein
VIAVGESSPTKIGGLLHRPATSLTHQLSMLESAGFIDRRHDLMVDRRPVITVTDPLVRFHQLVIEPYLADLEAGRARQVLAEELKAEAARSDGKLLLVGLGDLYGEVRSQ